MKPTNKHQAWYHKGLKFSCTECGKCCRGAAGYVWISLEEIQEQAHFLHLPLEEFVFRYVRKIGNRYSLREVKIGSEYHCVFLDDKTCTLYSKRPMQCRTFPWWPQNIKTAEAWENLSTSCEGVNRNGAPSISALTIDKERDSYELYLNSLDA